MDFPHNEKSENKKTNGIKAAQQKTGFKNLIFYNMARTRKKSRRRKYNKSLFGIGNVSTASSQKGTVKETLTKGGLVLLSAVAASGAGAALGKHSLIAGLPVFFFGIHKNNPYMAAAGLGLSLSNGFQKPGQSTQGIDGFDIKQIAEQAKDRVGTFFENFK